MLERFQRKFPGREVFNNIGLSHYRLATKFLGKCNPNLLLRFKLSTLIDPDIPIAKSKYRRNQRDRCFESPTFQSNLQKAIRFLKRATTMDLLYLPARVNLSSALILAGKNTDATSQTDEVLAQYPDHPAALNNQAVALYLFGQSRTKSNMVDTALDSLKKVLSRNPMDSDALYNQGAILFEQQREGFQVAWNSFLKQTSQGAYAKGIREKLKLVTPPRSPKPCLPPPASPFALGELKALSKREKALLRTMTKSRWKIGKFSGQILRSPHVRILITNKQVESIEKSIVDVVETVLKPTQEWGSFQQQYGSPTQTLPLFSGAFHLYSDFAAEVRNAQVTHLIFFQEEPSRQCP